MVIRYAFGVALGLVATFLLFMIMESVIKSDRNPFTEGFKGKIVDIVRLDQDEEIEVKKRKPPKPPPPDEPPPDMPKPDFDNTAVSRGVDVGAVDVNVDLNVGGVGGFSSDGEYLPIVKVAPVYPRRAQTRGIEGYVLLEFIVTKTGAVENPVVIESSPPGIFDRAAVQAALKFKYKPKVVNGEPIDVAGVRNRITFELAE
ncbi:MAG: energy transducer TonB [Pseudomonadales bacterium]|jgi:protein TonB